MPTPAHVRAIATVVPSHAVSTDDVKAAFPRAFQIDDHRLASIHSVIDNARIRTRHFAFPLDYIIRPRPLEQTSAEFKQQSIALGEKAASQALADSGLTPGEIDLIITVSCTGIMIPSLDAHLANRMGLRASVKRLPITELGCAGGAAAFGRAADYIRAYPDANVLIVVVELPSLTLQCQDPSPANLISCCLFGDGAAAAVLTGKPAPGLAVLGSSSHLLPDSLDAMGFDLRGTGLHIVLSKDVPHLVRNAIGEAVGCLLDEHQLCREDLEFFLIHPGGQKLLCFVEQQLALTPANTRASWKVLEDYGNLSAATVLFVAKEFLTQSPPPPGSRGLMAAFGPGFSIELVLMQWN